ncbi:MAG: family 10 glycosylhydrolase [Bacteroidales bacterium]|nr:family 10 glycosylhydrolase [Bacteroidales bacterium]
MKMTCLTWLLPLLLLSCSAGKAPQYAYPDPEEPSAEPSATPHGPEKDGKRVFLWVDTYANMYELANSEENIRRDLGKAADCGFTDIVVEVRASSGGLFYKSAHGDPVTWLSAYRNGDYIKIERTATFDYLQAFIDIGHELGLRIYAAFQTFSGGFSSSYGNTGPVYDHPELQKMVTVLNTADGLRSMLEVKAPGDVSESFIKFLNPVDPDVQDYLLAQIEDLAAYGATGLDGIILDRGRFYGYQSDFSDVTRQAFEKYIGTKIPHWPQDVCPVGWGYDPARRAVVESLPSPLPKYHLQWLEFRAKVIYDFMAKARAVVKNVDPGLDFGAYSGGWYSSFFPNGVNWASPNYDPSTQFSWATPQYKQYGYAALMDVLIIGAYAPASSLYGSTEWTVEGFSRLAKNKVQGAAGLLVVGPDIGNWDPYDQVSFEDECKAIAASIPLCGRYADGCFIFDMCHLRISDQWKYAKQGIHLLTQ